MIIRALLFLLFFTVHYPGIVPCTAYAQNEYTATVQRYPYNLENLTIIGAPTWHQVQPKETLLDIAREYGLGYNDIELFYPQMDPWIPPQRRITIPTFWILPPTQKEQLVINVPELRLYYLDRKTHTVQTYPLGIGVEGWETPLGAYHITDKRPNPSWYIPASLQAEYGMSVMPPGPQNPLGEYIMKFSAGAYGIHGTHIPWGVGRLVSHGCIRSYPEHIRLLYPQVPVGTNLEILYEPIKFGRKGNQIFVEVHPDVYGKLSDFEAYALDKLNQYPQADMIDEQRYLIAVRLKNGVPTNVTSPEITPLPAEELFKEPTTPLYQTKRRVTSQDTPSWPAGDSSREFTIQTASLRNQENAQELVEELRAKGYDSNVQSVDLGNAGQWFRVLVGNFATRQEALRFAEQLEEKEQLHGFVIPRESLE